MIQHKSPPMAETETETSDQFREDDLEFRTITTLLHMLKSHDEQRAESNEVAPHVRKHLKLLTSVSAMLVMNHEVIAMIPKHSATGLTLFIGTEPTNCDPGFDNFALPSLHLLAKNPRDNDSLVSFVLFDQTCPDNCRTDSVSLMEIPVVDIDEDIFQFIVKNWSAFPPPANDTCYTSFQC